ncbi:winged helix-turn-helix domain-containing protein [Sphingomicrobium nitratireducens]|uniref:winged helix-turn-helix domain-containing protein n=1 Tax=Sphingomicrobium nitratireducens TaxID=2964666 RepID=UPI00223FBD94|nr:winged helix-turn-helix domain-containing protein [Sphingomicrobium nitratireducens]
MNLVWTQGDSPGPAAFEDGRIVLAHLDPFLLGGAEIHPASLLVIDRQRQEHRIEPRAMQVLVALHRADGDILSREDLIGTCWDGLNVSDNAISRVISQLRKLARELDEERFEIETVPKVGYRLAGRETEPLAPRDRPARWTLALAGALALLGGSILVATFVERSGPSVTETVEAADHALLSDALSAYEKGDSAAIAEAIDSMSALTRRRPDMAGAWAMLAMGRRFQEEFGLESKDPHVNAATADILFDRARRLDPDNPYLLHTEAALHIFFDQPQRPDLALALLDKAIALDPGNAHHWHLAALSAELAFDHERMLEASSRFAQLAPDDFKLPTHAYIAWRSGRGDDARRWLERYGESNRRPGNREAARALLAGMEGDWSTFAVAMRQASRAAGEADVRTYENLADAAIMRMGYAPLLLGKRRGAIIARIAAGNIPAEPYAQWDTVNRVGAWFLPIGDISMERLVSTGRSGEVVDFYDDNYGSPEALMARHKYGRLAFVEWSPWLVLAMRAQGRTQDAERILDVALDMTRAIKRSRATPGTMLERRARLETLAGNRDEALLLIEEASRRDWMIAIDPRLADPVGPPSLASNPIYASLRDNPRFRAIDARYAARIDREAREFGAAVDMPLSPLRAPAS